MTEVDIEVVVHHWPTYAVTAMCGERYGVGAPIWPDVSCGACWAAERARRRTEQIERAQAAADEALRQTAEWARVHRDAEALLARLRASLADQNAALVGHR